MENKNISETKQKTKFNPGSILLLIGLLLIAVGVVLTTFVPQEEPNTETPNQPSEETLPETETEVGQLIELSKETEEITYDENLRIKFIGTKSSDMENAYKYKAEIYLNGELLSHNFYTGQNIYSSNYGAHVKIYKLEGTYIISSFIAKQCNGNDVLVFTSDKTEMTPYLDVTLGVDQENSKYTISKCGDCMDVTTCQEKTQEVPKLTK